MAYITGTQFDFENRLHSFASTSGDLTTGYYIEGQSYTGIDSAVLEKWNREYNLKYFSLTSQVITGTF